MGSTVISSDPKAVIEANLAWHAYEVRRYAYTHLQTFDQEEIQLVVEKFSQMNPGVERIHRFLDVGTGTGRILLCLKAAGLIFRGYGCDLSTQMLKEAEKNAKMLRQNVHLLKCNLENLPYPDGFFNVVGGGAVLHHVPNVKKALREVFRVLTDGGTVFFWGEPSSFGHLVVDKFIVGVQMFIPKMIFRAVRNRMGDGLSELETPADAHTFNPCELKKAFEDVGFQSVNLTARGFVRSICHKSLAPLQGRLFGVNYFFCSATIIFPG